MRVPTPLRQLAAGAATVRVGVDAPVDQPTVAAVLDALAALHPALERRVRDEQGRTRPHVNLFVGPDNVRDLQGLATTLAPGAELSIIAAVSGG